MNPYTGARQTQVGTLITETVAGWDICPIYHEFVDEGSGISPTVTKSLTILTTARRSLSRARPGEQPIKLWTELVAIAFHKEQ